jgi:alanine racemase
MGRYGAAPEEFAELVARVRSSDRLELAGTWTHLASSDSDPEFTRLQLQTFLAATEGLPGLRHAANSGAVLRHPESALDAVRVGIALYGCGDPRLEPVLQLRARVAHLKNVAAGATVGYGRTWTASSPARIATVTIGYADGIHRARANRGQVLVRGGRAPLVGAVSMDSIALDVSEIAAVELGDPVTVIGRDGEEEIRAEEAASWSGTISYEVLTSIGRRVERSYSDHS